MHITNQSDYNAIKVLLRLMHDAVLPGSERVLGMYVCIYVYICLYVCMYVCRCKESSGAYDLHFSVAPLFATHVLILAVLLALMIAVPPHSGSPSSHP